MLSGLYDILRRLADRSGMHFSRPGGVKADIAGGINSLSSIVNRLYKRVVRQNVFSGRSNISGGRSNLYGSRSNAHAFSPDIRGSFPAMRGKSINMRFNQLNRRIYRSVRRSGFGGYFSWNRYRMLSIKDLLLYILPLLLLILILPPLERKKDDIASSISYVEEEDNTGGKVIEITVYNTSRSAIEPFELEEYVVGVVAAEMPASFHEEALKAQAVAARTFALSRMKGLYGSAEQHYGAHVCTDPGHCQAWVSKERYLELYHDEYGYEKIRKACEATKNIVMTYDGVLINPLYHANSGGVTEDIEAVWAVSGEVPYLRSVYSVDESQYSQYISVVNFTWDEIREKLMQKYPEDEVENNFAKEIEIMSYSASGRVEEIRIGNIHMPGTEFRELLDLRSTNIEIDFPDPDTVEITTRGYGHGVGMSQCGADVLGKNGYKFNEILEYYYTGIMVEEIKQ